MIAAVDVQYHDDGTATAALVLFEEWTAQEPSATKTMDFEEVADYAPGEFFLRELPCILPLLREVVSQHTLKAIVIDGYVDLGDQKPGLGRHLQRALATSTLGRPLEIIGVAKSSYAHAPMVEVFRGESRRPLFVTSTEGLPNAAKAIHSMDGKYRMPTLLKLVDQLARGHGCDKNVAPIEG